MADLISLTMLTNRLGPNVTVDATQAGEFITDVSAQARRVARGKLDLIDDTTIEDEFPEVIGALVSCARRSLVNPDAFGSEMLDGYRNEQAPKDGVFLSAAEKSIIRGAVGIAATSATQTLVSPYSGDDETTETL